MSEFERLVVQANGGKVDGAQSRLAEKVGVKSPTVNRWCKMKSVPKPDQQAPLAKALGISVDQLMALFPGGGGGASMVAENDFETRLRALEAAVSELRAQLSKRRR